MLERWNPTVKAFTVLICVILLSFEYLVSPEPAGAGRLPAAVDVLLPGKSEKDRRHPAAGLHCGVRPVCDRPLLRRGGSTQTMDLSSLSAMPYSVRAALSQNLYTALQLATRLLAYAGLGILFALSTEGDFFIASLLHQCHLPPKFAYGILAAFHLMPGMAREYAQVRTAFAGARPEGGPALDEAGLHHAGQQRPLVGVHRHGHGVQGLFAGMRRVPIIRYHGCTGMIWPPRRSWWAAWCWECCF